MVKPILMIILMGILAFLFVLLVIFVEDPLMDSYVSTGPNITLDMWRESFKYWAWIGIGGATAAALIWFLLGQLTSMNNWVTANRQRVAWLGLFFVAGLAVIPGIVMTPFAQEGRSLAWAVYIVNNLSLYYLATALFSPSSFKYVPLLSMRLRFLW